ncbi:hypothetical protein H6G80_03945 [Nostoc sp. FACHB-87]|uniref:hypothetical protein n=1 Tax=Nostocaceae TaxID=1162 RepID=UPI001684C4E4|nr:MULTISPECIES: hypothetical protein [Nostocaceae]MBD2298945.1 hypothetical protein [Nostoc sp. FACHB-190]MBD2453227.1 hypothetical protein [Nostoc sp. FACHB-87]MBD2474993.1 hypothetical protein [Anabaena sp. FACHB-83]
MIDEYLSVLSHKKAAQKVTKKAPGEILDPLEGIARTQAAMLNLEPTSENLESIDDALSSEIDLADLVLKESVNLMNLSGHFWNKSLVGFGSPEVLRTMPELPSELAAIALRCASESRKYLQLLNEIRNPKRATFIKTQQNALIVDQPQNLLEETQLNGWRVDTRTQRTTEADSDDCQAVAKINRPKNRTRKAQKLSK